jgi:hypothetical protein
LFFLQIAVTATCISGKPVTQNTEIEENKPRKISKRDTAILIDNFPVEPLYSGHKPKVIYRRVSRQKYGPPKAKYGPPKPKYGPPSKNRKPIKKYRKQLSSTP